MRNFLGNRWGKIGLMLFVCLSLYGLTATAAYSQVTCCYCQDTNWYTQVSGDCGVTCSNQGSAYGGYTYQRRSDSACGASCSNYNSTCKSTTQVVCWESADHTVNKTTTCQQKNTPPSDWYICKPDAVLNRDDSLWDPCPSVDGKTGVCCEWGGNWDENSNTLLNDSSCDCIANPYGS